MNKLVSLTLATLLQASAALAQDAEAPLPPDTPHARALYAAVASATHTQMPYDREKFWLALGPSGDPAFASTTPAHYETLHCEDTASLRMYGFANEIGGIEVAICADAAHLQAIAGRARDAADATARELRLDDDKRRRLGWTPQRQRLPDGSEFLYQPTVMIGHGVLVRMDGLLVGPAGQPAVVVLLNPQRLCDPEHNMDPAYFLSRPLCKDTPAALLAIAREVREKMRQAPAATGVSAGTSAAPS